MADYAADISINDYLYRQEITITETGGEDRTSFPVKLSLTSSNFNFALARSDGYDIRIAEASNGTRVLNTWIASWSNDAEVGTVWLKIPNLLSGEAKTLYVYWGHTNASDVSNIDEIGFLFADGFDGKTTDNLALNKTCSQSSTGGPYPALNAVDGDVNTYSHTGGGTWEWWKVDLGDYYSIGSIQFIKDPDSLSFPDYYYIQTADDYAFTSNVVNIANAISDRSLDRTYILSNITARYLRVFVHTNVREIVIVEFRVFESLLDYDKWNISGLYSISDSKVVLETDAYIESLGFPFYACKDPNIAGMVIDIESEGTYDTIRSFYCCVIKDDSVYKMWYGGYDDTNYRIIYTTSTDGINWSNYQMVIDYNQEGTYDDTHALHPFVIKESPTSYKMWYGGYDGTYWSIMYATSTDGITWSNYQFLFNRSGGTTYDDYHVAAPWVIKESPTSYKMWYGGHDGSYWRISYAESTDGITWSSRQMIIDRGAEGTYDTSHTYRPSVIKDGSIYKMWYMGADASYWRTLYAESTDGINWSNHRLVIDLSHEGIYDTTQSSAPAVIKDGSVYKMWYSGYNGVNYRIIYAASTDGITFQSPYSNLLSNWIVEEGVYVDNVGTSTTLACHRYRCYGTENNFGFNFFREGATDRTHNVVNSSTYVTYNGTDRGFDASGYSENYIGYKEPTDRVYQGMSSRPNLSDYDDSWERKVYGDTRITYFRIYGRDDDAAHQIGVDWVVVREYFVVDPYTLDTSNLYVPYETVHHETIDLTPYGDDVTDVDFLHTTESGGDPYKLSDNISGAVGNCWYSNDDTTYAEIIIDFGRGSEDYNLVSTEYIHYDDGHTGHYNASKLSNSNDDEYFQGTTTSGYVCIDLADDNIEVGCLSVKARSGSLTGMIKNFTFLGGYKDPRFSTDSDWTTLCSGTFQQELVWQPIYFVNENPYRYYKLDIIDTYGSTPVLQEWKIYQHEPLNRSMIISQLRLNPVAFDSQEVYFPKQIALQGSNNMIDWTDLMLTGSLNETWIYGSGVPSPSLGNFNDYYMDTDNGNVYLKYEDILDWEYIYTQPYGSVRTATPFYNYLWNRWQRFSFENTIGYYNYKLICYGNWNDNSGPIAIAEWEMVEKLSEAYTHKVLAGTSNDFSSVWASPTTTFDSGFIYIGDGGFLNTVYDDSLNSSTVVSGIIDINLI